jgi:cell division protein FtsX
MPDDLMTEVRNMLDDGAAPITLDELHDRRSLAPLLPSRAPRRASWIVAGVAAAAVVVIVATFAVITSSDDRQAVATFASASVECAPSPDATLQVFLPLGATDDQIEAARVALAQTPGVAVDRYLDHQGAMSQFACIFADNPELVSSIRATDLPVSFAVKSDSVDDEMIARLKASPNVTVVYTPADWQKHVDEERAGEVDPTPSSQPDTSPSSTP